ncbi:MAG: zinc ABC transporter substrate-binding protein, partial [Candidatus Thiodiazotropha sp.]
IRQINQEKITAVFVENVSDRRLIDQIVRETGARIGGTLYSDALSNADGPAGTYLGMMRHNIRVLVAALRK